MSDLFRENLSRFNRKERFYVVKHATNGGFELNTDFKLLLEKELEITLPKQGVFVAMDYHFDWIYASLFLCCPPVPNRDGTYNLDNSPITSKSLITATQEDVDLLIAAPDPANPTITNLIMIEAKGETPWTNEQASSKAERLNSIFTKKFEQLVKPHYLLWSPKRPTNKLIIDNFPKWAKQGENLRYITLDMGGDLLRIERCDKIHDNPREYKTWKIVPT